MSGGPEGLVSGLSTRKADLAGSVTILHAPAAQAFAANPMGQFWTLFESSGVSLQGFPDAVGDISYRVELRCRQQCAQVKGRVKGGR